MEQVMIFNNENLSYKNGDSATVSVTDWILFDAIGLLNLVPIAGPIAAIILYVLIAANYDSAPSVQNRIIVNFIWLGVWLLAGGVLGLLVWAGVIDVAALAMRMMGA